MAESDIVQRIVIEVVDQASAALAQVKASASQITGSFQQLGQQVGQAFTPATAAVQKFGQTTATSFAQATQSIAALGSTAPEALAAAQAAATKFGASAQELQSVTGVIQALGARVRDGSKTFTELATNVDKARGSVSEVASATTAAANGASLFSRAFSAISSGVSGAVSAFGSLASSVKVTHGELRVLESAASALVPGLGSLTGIVVRAGSSFGVLAAAVAAAGAMDTATVSAARNARALTDLAEAAGQSRERLSALQGVFRENGVDADQFNSSIGSLLSKLRSAAPQMAADWAEAGDKIKGALLSVQEAMLKIADTKLSADQLDLQRQQIALNGEQLRLQAQTFAFQRQSLALSAQQAGVNLSQIQLQLQSSGQLFQIDRQRAALTVADAEANLRILLLKKQLRDGLITEEEFEQRMAAEEDRALNRAIAKARVDVDAAKAAQRDLPAQQELQQRSLEIQAAQLRLQQDQLPIQQQMINLAERQNDLAQRQNQGDALKNALDIQKNILEQQRDQLALNKANLDLQKEQANNLKALVDKITEALAKGQSLKDIKFDPLTTDDAKAKAIFKVLEDMKAKGVEVQTVLGQLFDKMPKAEAVDLGKLLGLGPDFTRTLTDIGTKIDEVTTKALNIKLGFSEEDFRRLEGALTAWQSFSGAIVNAKDALGAFNADAAKADFTILKNGLDAAKGSAEGLATALKALGVVGGESRGGEGIEGALFGKGGIAGFWETLKANINRIIPSGGILDLIGKALVLPAGAAELDPLKQAIIEPIKQALDEASQLDTSSISGLTDAIAQQFAGLSDKIREVIGSIDLGAAFAPLVEAAPNAVKAIGEAFSSIDITEPLSSQIDALIQKFDQLVAAANRAAAAAGGIGSGGGGGGGGGGSSGGGDVGIGEESFVAALARGGDAIIAPSLVAAARGGMVWGAGSATSDSIMAMLSRGEYVIRAAAVQKYGPALFDLINSLQYQFPRFAPGGLAMPRLAAIPAFAAGGPGSRAQGRTFHLSFGGETFRNLIAPEEVAQKMERAAISRQTSATGIKPRWSR